MKVTITGNHTVDGVDPGGTLDVGRDRAWRLARAGHISWDDLRAKPAKKATRKKAAATRKDA